MRTYFVNVAQKSVQVLGILHHCLGLQTLILIGYIIKYYFCIEAANTLQVLALGYHSDAEAFTVIRYFSAICCSKRFIVMAMKIKQTTFYHYFS